MASDRAPFRADHVGSILRTAPIKTARERQEAGEISAGEMAAVQDAEIVKIIAKQEEAGLRLATDGELRRKYWSYDYLWELEGLGYETREAGVQFAGVVTKGDGIKVEGKIRHRENHPMLDHFRFLAAHTKVTPKMTIPSPSVLHWRIGADAMKDVYPDIDEFFDDVGEAYRRSILDFYDAGCRYLQLDDTVWTYLCSEAERAKCRARGDDPDKLPERYARCVTKAISSRPDDMAITTHLCRGNFRSAWLSEGGYEPVAEILLGALPYDGYFLEYDTERAGGFEPLRFLPKGDKRVVLGLVTSKFGELEDKDALKARIDEAAKFADIDQLCLSPQCGFASTEEGNLLSEDEQWAKLRFVVEVANEVWGG